MNATEYLSWQQEFMLGAVAEAAENKAALEELRERQRELEKERESIDARIFETRKNTEKLARCLMWGDRGIEVRHYRNRDGEELPLEAKVSTALADIEIRPRPTSRSGKTRVIELRLSLWNYTGTIPPIPEPSFTPTSKEALLKTQFELAVKMAETILEVWEITSDSWLKRQGIDVTTLPTFDDVVVWDLRLETGVRYYDPHPTSPVWSMCFGGIVLASIRPSDIYPRLDWPEDSDDETVTAWANDHWDIAKGMLLKRFGRDW